MNEEVMTGMDKRAADKLAYAVAKCIENKALDERSAPADALLDYLCVGQPGGPMTVPEWVRQYEDERARHGKL